MNNVTSILKKIFVIDINASKRIYGLDILRALAIFFVVISHGIKILPSGNPIRNVSMYMDFDGVSVFFVLSGFLIGGIIIKVVENKKATFETLFNFWIRRWLRTLPNYFFVLILLVFILPMIYYGRIEDSLGTKFKFALFIQNFSTKHPYFFPEAWSLSIEEWFYLFIPIYIFILIGFFKTKPKKAVLIVSVSVLLLVTYFRYYRFINFPPETLKDWDVNFRKQVVTRLDSLMFGVIGAYIAYYYKYVWIKYKIALLVLGIVIFCIEKYSYHFMNPIEFGLYMTVFSFSIVSISTLMVIPYLSELKKGKGYLFKAITVISLISYSMYLINLTVVQEFLLSSFPENLETYVYLRYFCYWFFILFGSTLMYKFVELPFMKLRNKITK